MINVTFSFKRNLKQQTHWKLLLPSNYVDLSSQQKHNIFHLCTEEMSKYWWFALSFSRAEAGWSWWSPDFPLLLMTCCCCCCQVASVVSDSVRPHRQQPTRLPRPWDSPGKNTGVGCHFLLQCMKVKSEREVAQLCLTLSDPMDCSPPGSSVHGIFQVRVLECHCHPPSWWSTIA